MSNEKRIGTVQILHASALSIGAVFLALGVLFYALEFQWVMMAFSILPRAEAEAKHTGTFIWLSWTYGGIGLLIIVASTITSIIFVRRSKTM